MSHYRKKLHDDPLGRRAAHRVSYHIAGVSNDLPPVRVGHFLMAEPGPESSSSLEQAFSTGSRRAAHVPLFYANCQLSMS